MTIEEVFVKLITHMSEGVSYHDYMAQAYEFLGLWGCAKCQRYHQFEEESGRSRLIHYYATHYFKLVPIENYNKPEIISDTWYKYTTQDVDTGTKLRAIKELVTKWVAWERSTKKLYQEMQNELIQLKEFDSARKLNEYIHDVSTELHDVEKLLLKLETVSYDPIFITEWSDALNKKYKKKLGW